MLARVTMKNKWKRGAFFSHMGCIGISVILMVVMGMLVDSQMYVILGSFALSQMGLLYFFYRNYIESWYVVECFDDYISVVTPKYKRDFLYGEIENVFLLDANRSKDRIKKKVRFELKNKDSVTFIIEGLEKEDRELFKSTLRQKHGKPFKKGAHYI